MVDLEYSDIQGIVLRGYRTLQDACFVMLRIANGAQTRAWLGRLAERITVANPRHSCTEAVQLAITHEGLRVLGVPDDTRFSCEFERGIAVPYISKALGDVGASCPSKWIWGSNGTPVHLVLMLYSVSRPGPHVSLLDTLYRSYQRHFNAGGLIEVTKLNSVMLPDGKEHFGFADGISQPIVDGTRRARDGAVDVVPAGEFLLGYENAYHRYPQSPSIPATLDCGNFLREVPGKRRDLGRNGTYLVFRQLQQDVRGFWRFLDSETATGGVSDGPARDRLAAKMVGRWRSGVSLVKNPATDCGRPDSDFMYTTSESGLDDGLGVRCPLGAHIRRSNPRDSVFPGTPDLITDAEKHRILRRGRPYGPAIAESMDPHDILAADATEAGRGLCFICLNADIGRQFEFVQQTWLNNPRFAGLYGEVDPVVGPGNTKFTIPGDPIGTRVHGIDRYVQVRGGAYFFLPSISAIRALAALRPAALCRRP